MLRRKLFCEILIVLNTDFWVGPRDKSIELQLIVQSLVKSAKLVDVALESLNVNPEHLYRSLIRVEALAEPVGFGAKEFLEQTHKLDLDIVAVLNLK